MHRIRPGRVTLVRTILLPLLLVLAGTASRSEDLPFTGTLEIFDGAGFNALIEGSAAASGTPLSFVIPPAFGPATVSQSVPSTILTEIRCDGCGLGTLSIGNALGPAGGIGASGGVFGTLVHRYFGFVETQVPLSILGVEGGSFVSTALTATAGGWTTGTAVVTGLGSPTPTKTLQGTDDRTALGSGTIVLVAPMRVNSSVAGQ